MGLRVHPRVLIHPLQKIQNCAICEKNNSDHVRFEVFMVVTMKKAVFWDVAPCRSGVNRRFGGTYRLHLQGRREIIRKSAREASVRDVKSSLVLEINNYWES
jgi:hypothetical protein